MEQCEIRDLIEVKNDWKKLAQEQAERLERYEKALEEITRQYDYTTVNRAKKIAYEALGDLTDERRREIQSY
jgi:16S rRNA G527 N7-methylase RsmG